MEDNRIPVTLLTGFLGAGKTTFLNAILTEQPEERIAVIVNEFGEAGLDHDLIETASDDIVLMASGCLCCTVRGELADTMMDLLARRAAGAFDFDRVMIETTGLADPGPILQTMLIENALAQNTRMDGVVTVVDGANGPQTLDTQFEAVSQVAMADLIVLNKTDLISTDQKKNLETRLRGLNTTAPIVSAVKGANVGQQIWGLSALRAGTSPANVLSWVAPSAPVAQDPLGNLSGFALPSEKTATFTPHDGRIETASIVLDAPISDDVFDDWLNTLVRNHKEKLLRVKGVVFLEGIEMPFVFHGVQQIFDPPTPIHDWPEDDTKSRVTVIARDLSQKTLQHSLDMLRADMTNED